MSLIKCAARNLPPDVMVALSPEDRLAIRNYDNAADRFSRHHAGERKLSAEQGIPNYGQRYGNLGFATGSLLGAAGGVASGMALKRGIVAPAVLGTLGAVTGGVAGAVIAGTRGISKQHDMFRNANPEWAKRSDALTRKMEDAGAASDGAFIRLEALRTDDSGW